MLMMRPYLCSIMCRPKTCMARKVPVRFVSNIAFHSGSHKSRVGVRFVWPAQFKRICTLPNVRQAASSNAFRLSLLVTSQVTGSDFRPSATISWLAASTSSERRPVGITFAPAVASPRAKVSPMPLVPPITTAVLSVRSKRGWPIYFSASYTFDATTDRISCGRSSEGDAPLPGNEVILPKQLCLSSNLAACHFNHPLQQHVSHLFDRGLA